jgi:hypothetical protein
MLNFMVETMFVLGVTRATTICVRKGLLLQKLGNSSAIGVVHVVVGHGAPSDMLEFKNRLKSDDRLRSNPKERSEAIAMTENFYDIWSPVVERVARWVVADFPDVEPDDLTQDLYVEIMERHWTDPQDKRVNTVLVKVAKDKALKYRAEHLILSPQYNYRTSDVRRILKRVFEHQDWIKGSQWPDCDPEGAVAPPRSNSEPSYSLDETLVEFSDVKYAWERLPLGTRKTLFSRYCLGEEATSKSEERKIQRAVVKLTDYLNTYQSRRGHEGPGSRRIPTQAHAAAIVSTDYSPSSRSPSSYRYSQVSD